MAISTILQEGAFTSDIRNALNANFIWTSVVNAYTTTSGTDAVTFTSAINIAIFTVLTTADAATLATPGASDVGKILILVNTNTIQNTVTTASGKLLNGAAAGHILTAPATAGAVSILIASNGFWNIATIGTGTWVLS